MKKLTLLITSIMILNIGCREKEAEATHSVEYFTKQYEERNRKMNDEYEKAFIIDQASRGKIYKHTPDGEINPIFEGFDGGKFGGGGAGSSF